MLHAYVVKLKKKPVLPQSQWRGWGPVQWWSGTSSPGRWHGSTAPACRGKWRGRNLAAIPSARYWASQAHSLSSAVQMGPQTSAQWTTEYCNYNIFSKRARLTHQFRLWGWPDDLIELAQEPGKTHIPWNAILLLHQQVHLVCLLHLTKSEVNR